MSASDFEINEHTTIDEIKQNYAEYIKLYRRIARHGDPSIVLSKGRKPFTEEQKEEARIKRNEKNREARRLKAIAEGREPCMGRPRKNKIAVSV
jgi:hypothetical protein